MVGKVRDAKDPNFGFNAQTGQFEDLVKAGVIDPTKVVRTCVSKGQPTAPDSPNGQWEAWARNKADWLDPLVYKSTHTHSPHS